MDYRTEFSSEDGLAVGIEFVEVVGGMRLSNEDGPPRARKGIVHGIEERAVGVDIDIVDVVVEGVGAIVRLVYVVFVVYRPQFCVHIFVTSEFD